MKRWESKANSSLYSSETEKNKIMSTLVQTHTKTSICLFLSAFAIIVVLGLKTQDDDF